MLLDMEKIKNSILKPYGHTETLFYYSKVAPKLKNFLKGKEIAAKNWIPKGPMPYLIKRGSKLEPLYIEEFSCIDEKFLKTRAEMEHLGEAASMLTAKQKKIWEYFLPRKLADFFYATNGEKAGKPIERIFIDIDRGKDTTSEQAQEVARILVGLIKADKELQKGFPHKLFVMWTGSSFHVYLLLKKQISNAQYEQFFAYKKDFPLQSFIGRWAAAIQKQVGFKVSGSHEKIPQGISLDPSQTPSGKLARAPFSLHMKTARQVDGVALPVEEKQLNDKQLIKKLSAYTPEKVLEELNKLAKLLP